MKRFALVFLGLLCMLMNLLYASEPKEYLESYYYFQTEERVLYENIMTTRLEGFSRNETLDFISRFEELQNIDYLIYKHVAIAGAWYHINEKENAVRHFVKSFEHGHHLSKLNPDTYSLIFDTLKVLFPAAYKKHYERVDSTLHKTLAEMLQKDQLYRGSDTTTDFGPQRAIDSLNAILLTDIVKLHGWPGKVLTGHVDPTLIVLHLSQKHNYFFLEHILEACAKNRVPWSHAERVISNLLMRFESVDRHTKMRYLFTDNRGYLDVKSSYLSLHTLAENLLRHPQYGMEFFTTHLYNGEDFQVLRDIEKFMLAFGVEPGQIKLAEEIIEAKPGSLGEYAVASKLFMSGL